MDLIEIERIPTGIYFESSLKCSSDNPTAARKVLFRQTENARDICKDVSCRTCMNISINGSIHSYVMYRSITILNTFSIQ
eukprot:m.489297 g.489297  ORF g.489297 m.489297 type:complete len:80 (+) comp21764_c0_seq4:579-818(+)